MTSEWPPAPPKGYQLDNPDYDQPWYITVLLSGWVLSMFVAVPALVIALKGPETTIRLAYAVFRHENFSEWLVYLLWVLGMVGLLGVVHEAIHALCSRWFGFRVQFGIEYSNLVNLTPTTLTYGGFQSRGQSLAIVLAPLVVLTPISVIVLVVSADFWIQASAVFITLGNTVGSVGDLGKAWMIVKLPAGELTFHGREGRQQYYTPTNEEETVYRRTVIES